MKYLAGIAELPYPTPAGRIVTRPGYDPETRTYLHLPPDWQVALPRAPDADSVRRALVTMMRPWRAYRWAAPDDAAAMVSAVLAAVSRPTMELCPAYLFGAAQQGSGKTKAACALGALIEGRRPAVTPIAAASRDGDEELRKKLLAAAIDGTRFICFDNVTGHLKSAALSAVLTSGRLGDRVLGESRNATVQVRSLLTLTANNLSLDADLLRRTASVRIDAGERPTHKTYSFCPMTEALAARREIVTAALLVQRAYFAAGAPVIVPGDAGGFDDWNRLCRQPVLWAAREGLADALGWSLGDPAASMLGDPADSDPEIESLGALLRAAWAISGGADFTSSDALQWLEQGERDGSGDPFGEFRAAVLELVGRAELTARSLGRALMYRRDRAVGGLKLLSRQVSGPVRRWRVVAAAAAD